MIKKKILIATGGTGGHVFPAYSLANSLKEDYNVILTTDKRGLNYLKNYKNIAFKIIHSSPLIKKNFLSFLFSLIIIFFSIIKSFVHLLFKRPAIVLGMGGYSSFPICIAATILRIKFVIYENNLIIGKANKFLLPFAKKIFVSYNDLEGISDKYSDKVFQIGNLVREEIINLDITDNYKKNFEKINILVLGGSQAARIFGNELPQIFEKLKNSNFQFKIYQQCQKQQNDQLSNFYQRAKIEYEIFNFTDKIIEYYLKSNLVITRSGASVLGELINVKLPFISIPLPTSAENHQFKNAEFYQKKGCGYLLEEKDIKKELYNLIKSIYEDKSIIKKILSNQRQFSDKEIFRTLRKQIEKLLNEKN